MQIQREIEPFPPQSARQRQIVGDPPRAARARRHDHLVEMRIMRDDGRRVTLDEIRDPGARIRPAQRPDERRREDDVADQSQANQEDLRSRYSIVASSISITGMSSLIG